MSTRIGEGTFHFSFIYASPWDGLDARGFELTLTERLDDSDVIAFQEELFRQIDYFAGGSQWRSELVEAFS